MAVSHIGDEHQDPACRVVSCAHFTLVHRPDRSIITIIALPMTPITILACAWALRKENRP